MVRVLLKATTARIVLVKIPFALFSLIICKVEPGAVVIAITEIMRLGIRDNPARKCKDTNTIAGVMRTSAKVI